jgi:ribonucleoside-triphosphate reductase (formate)
LQKSYERYSSEVLDAASAPVRLQILKLLTSQGPLPYTEIMTEAKLDPVRDAGKFVYHLKTLRKAGLVTVEKGTKKYSITELGGIIVEFSRDLEEYAAVKKGRLFVRTSKMAIEEFDRTRIAKSLVTEAGMPQALANEVSSEAEERLLRFGTTYITAPLIRELVNTILVERKLEEYRHRLTRLGLPVNDVTSLIREAGQKHLDSGWVEQSSGTRVTEEYVLLYAMPKPLADAHLSGVIHLEETGSWVLKPSQMFHDPRPFLKEGLPGSEPPSSFEAALAALTKLVRICESEVSREQILTTINFYLAPFIRDLEEDRITEAVTLFLSGLNWDGYSNTVPSRVTLGVSNELPGNLRGVAALGPGGRNYGTYDELTGEASKLSRVIITASSRVSTRTPLVNPSIILNISKDKAQHPETAESEAFESSSRFSTPNYLIQDTNNPLIISSEGCVFQSGSDKDWLARGAIVGTVLLNTPRAAYQGARRDEKFLAAIRQGALDAVKALELRRSSIEQRMKEGLLPLLSWQPDGQAYYGSNPVTAELGLTGLGEAVKYHTQSELGGRQTTSLLKRIYETVKQAAEESETPQLKVRVGLHPSPEAASRLAGIDSEKFGFSTLIYQGSKKYPYYTDVPAMPLDQKASLATRASLEAEVQSLFDGGSLLPVRLGPKADPSRLARVMGQLAESRVRYLTFAGILSSCHRCHHTSTGLRSRCENCNSDRLTILAGRSGRLAPIDIWAEAFQKEADKLALSDLN